MNAQSLGSGGPIVVTLLESFCDDFCYYNPLCGRQQIANVISESLPSPRSR